MARCSACERAGFDKTGDNLLATEGEDGWLHVKCQRGCPEDEILSALGLTQEDRRVVPLEAGGNAATRPPKPAGCDYTYTDRSGKPLFVKRRKYFWKDDQQGWKKTFVQEGVNGEKDLNHLSQEEKKILYRMPEVAEAIAKGETIVLGEGEKAADKIRDVYGLCATCQPAGAEGGRPETKWLPMHTEMLRGAAHVIVVADRDETGEAYAKYVAKAISAAVDCVEVVSPAVTIEKADAYDHILAGKKLDDFVPRPDLSPPRISDRIPRYMAHEIEAKPIDWLLYPYIAKGMLFGIEGDPGVGKSFICAALATAVSRGIRLPFFEDPFPKGRVLMIATEDVKESATRPRLDRFGAELDQIMILEDVWPFDRDGLKILDEIVRDFKPILVFIDPLTAFIDAATKTSRPTIDVHGIMTGLKQIAERRGCAIGCLRHMRKSNGMDSNPIYSGVGDISIVGKYRTLLQLRKDEEDHERRKRVIVTHPKSNIGPTGDSFAYRIVPVTRGIADFVWLGKVDITAEEMTGGFKKSDGKKLAEAKTFLLDLLAGQTVLQETVKEEAKEADIAWATVRRAASGLHIIQSNKGFSDKKYRWSLPVAVEPMKIDPFAEDDDEI